MAQDLGRVISAGKTYSNVYYDEKSEHLLKATDDVVQNNRFSQPFTSLQFGAQGISLTIPNDSLVSGIIVGMRFTGVADSGGNTLGLVPVAAYTAIQQIEWQIGGSTFYQNSGIQHFFSNLADCQSAEKRAELIRLAGGIGSKGGASFQTTTTYYAHIKLPYSNIESMQFQKNPLDSKLITQPLKVNLYLRPNTSVYYNLAGTVSFPTALADGFFQMQQANFQDANHNLKLKYDEIVDGKLITRNDFYAYPFSFVQDFVSPQFTGSAVGSTPVNISLTGFRAGNLLSIRLMLFNLTTNSPLTFPATANTNILAAESPLSVKLFFNGLEMFRSTYDSWKMSSLEVQVIPPLASLTVSGTTTDYYWLEIPFAQWLAEAVGVGYQKGVDMSSQTLILNLNTNSTDTYVIYGSYVYHAHVVMDGSNGDVAFQ